MLVVIQEPEGDLEFQRAAIDRDFRHEWASPEDGVLTEWAYAEARKVLGRGGWTGLDPATLEASATARSRVTHSRLSRSSGT